MNARIGGGITEWLGDEPSAHTRGQAPGEMSNRLAGRSRRGASPFKGPVSGSPVSLEIGCHGRDAERLLPASTCCTADIACTTLWRTARVGGPSMVSLVLYTGVRLANSDARRLQTAWWKSPQCGVARASMRSFAMLTISDGYCPCSIGRVGPAARKLRDCETTRRPWRKRHLNSSGDCSPCASVRIDFATGP